jgi:glycosyltransferase involved in cell wall biosynthesis
MTETVYINGKFTAQPTTGVQRVATELVRALDRQLLALADNRRWVLLCPAQGLRCSTSCIEVRVVGPGAWPLHLWEQCALPWHARDGVLINLTGSSPMVGRRQICMLHDAAVFDRPQAYGAAFVAWYRLLFRRQARQALALMTVSRTARARLAQHLCVAEARIHLVPNGGDHLLAVRPDAAVLDRLGLRGQRFVLAVGSANPSKNLSRLSQAFASLNEMQDLHLVVVGDGNAAVFAAGGGPVAGDRIHRVGRLGDAELKALYEAALALVFPSLYEGFGLPPLEAMSCGCPVLASNASSVPEVCGDAALYFDPLSVDAMTAALRQLVGDAALRQRLIVAGAARVRGMSWDAAATALRRVVGATT